MDHSSSEKTLKSLRRKLVANIYGIYAWLIFAVPLMISRHRQENVQHLVYAVSIFVNFISIFDTDLEVFEQQGGHICKYE